MADLQVSENIVEEIKQIFTEGEFNHRWSLIETYHEVGKIICKVKANRSDLLQALAPQVGKSVRSLWYASKFYETYPELDRLPEGKNVSMNKIITKYLTTSKQDECTHTEELIEIISFKVCKGCNKHLGKVGGNNG